jgi:hypothetical protein
MIESSEASGGVLKAWTETYAALLRLFRVRNCSPGVVPAAGPS